MSARRRWSLAWSDRPIEEATHFNPAFCGELIARSVHSYSDLRGAPLPLPLAFVLLPLALPSASRAALPRKANATFATWAVDHQAMLADVPERALQLRPVTREALLFLTQLGALKVGSGGFAPGDAPLKLSKKLEDFTDEVDEIRRTASFLGRWFAAQTSSISVLQTMGVRL